MAKNAHNQELYDLFLHAFMEEQTHPDLMKRFGLAIGLTERDFDEALPIFECQAHAAAILRGMFLGSPAESRTSALVNESMVGRYAAEFDARLSDRYGIDDHDREFFTVHAVADQEHTAIARTGYRALLRLRAGTPDRFPCRAQHGPLQTGQVRRHLRRPTR